VGLCVVVAIAKGLVFNEVVSYVCLNKDLISDDRSVVIKRFSPRDVHVLSDNCEYWWIGLRRRL